jgi:tRNA 2-thiouridine synthesizing protein E
MASDKRNDILDTVSFDKEGFMTDAKAWTREIGEAIAASLHIELGDEHWAVIDFARRDFAEVGEAPSLRRTTDALDYRTKQLFDLFPGNPSKLVAKVAGLPKPPGCI